MVRVILGILVLGFAVMITGPMILMAGLNPFEGLNDAPPLWLPLLFFLVPGALSTLVGALVVGRRFWADAVGWTLIAAALYGLIVFITMYMFIMSPESSEMFDSMDLQNSEIFNRDSVSIFRPVAIGLVMLAVGLPLAGWRFKEKLKAMLSGESASIVDLTENPEGRPISVSVISWLSMVTAFFGVLGWAFLLLGPRQELLGSLEQIWGVSVAAQIFTGIAGSATMFVCGFFLLKGKDWARWTILGYFIFTLALSLLLYKTVAFLIPGLAWTVAFYFFLFLRRPAKRFFRTGLGSEDR